MSEILREDARIVSQQNNRKSAAHYEKNSYVCVCGKGYTGKYSESGSVLYVKGNGTRLEKWSKRKHSQKKKETEQKKKNKAELVYEFYP